MLHMRFILVSGQNQLRTPFSRPEGALVREFPLYYNFRISQGHPTDLFLKISVLHACKLLLAGKCGRNYSPWKESVAGKKIIQGVRGDLKSRIAATGYLYGLLTTQDLNCAL